MDNITKGQRNLLLFIVSVAILFVPIYYVAVPKFNERKDIIAEKDEREVYYNDLKQKDVNRQQYIDDTATYTEMYEAVLAEFPSELYQENTIMYLEGIKNEYEFDFPSVTMGEETLFYTLGSGATGDASLDGGTVEVETDENGNPVASGDGYNCYSASFPVSYSGSYQSVKDVIDYIETSDYRMTVDSIDIAFNEETGDYEGSMTFSSYSVSGGERTTDQVNVNVQTGTNNIFGNPTVKVAAPTTEEQSAE
jgi:hypothetical protein